MAAIYKRGEVWWARAQRAGKERRVSLKTRDRRIAERRLRQWLDDLDAAQWGEAPSHTVAEAIARFLREHVPTLKPSSAKRYASSIRMMLPHLEGLSLRDVSRETLSAYETARRSDGASAPTIRRDLACLSSIMTCCEDWEWLPDNANPVPAYLRRRSKRGLKEAPPRTRYLSETEEAKLLSHATSGARDAIILAIDTGLRLEELMSLQWSQVDLRRGIIRTTTDTKSHRSRSVPIAQRSAQILAHLPRSLFRDWVFFDPDTGERYRDRKTAFRGAVRRAELGDLVWHDLRRTAGCRWLLRDGLSLHEVSVLLGHSSVKVTERHYAFLDSETVAERMGRTKTGTQAGD